MSVCSIDIKAVRGTTEVDCGLRLVSRRGNRLDCRLLWTELPFAFCGTEHTEEDEVRSVMYASNYTSVSPLFNHLFPHPASAIVHPVPTARHTQDEIDRVPPTAAAHPPSEIRNLSLPSAITRPSSADLGLCLPRLPRLPRASMSGMLI